MDGPVWKAAFALLPVLIGLAGFFFGFVLPHIMLYRWGYCKKSIVKVLKPDYAVDGKFCYGKVVSEPWLFNWFHLRKTIIIRDEDISQSAYHTGLISGSVERRITVWYWEVRNATEDELSDKHSPLTAWRGSI